MKTTWKTWAAAMMAVVGMLPLGCSGSVVQIGAQPPGCPTAAPKVGEACSVTVAGCIYDQGPCNVELSCDEAVGAWQSKTTSCSPAATECQFAQQGEVCATAGETCVESEMPCGGNYFNTCGDDHHWQTSYPGGGDDCCPLTGTCPATLPVDGQPCDPCYGAPSCGYPGTCGGDLATCGADAVWHVGIGVCPPPPPPDYCNSMTTEGACAMNADCRWLTPGCGNTPLPGAGCFTVADCGPGTCGPSQICQDFSYNPCFNKGCDACGATASICVGGL
jgi:hypothetical protein